MTKTPIIKLSELSRRIQQTFDAEFGNRTFWVIADVTSHTYKEGPQQHYFELVEKDSFSSRIIAKIAGRAWGTASVQIKNFERVTGQVFKDNINVLVNVMVQYHTLYGLQLNVLDIDVNFTLGQFEQQRNATIARLLAENATFIARSGDQFITKNNKLLFNKVLQRLAIVSSETSAGFQDFTHTLSNNSFGYQFDVDHYFTQVQGEANAKAVVEKLIEIYYRKENYDAVIIIRGGGAQSDFLIFDNYELSRAVAKFPIPVITGIGHQKNETIVDLMAHTATKTPTKAAEYIIEHNRMFEEGLFVFRQIIIIRSQQLFLIQHKQLGQLKSGLINHVLRLLKQQQYRVLSFSGVFVNRPMMLIANERKDLLQRYADINIYQKEMIKRAVADLSHYRTVIRMMSPQNILNKGFALLRVNGKIISNADLVREGEELLVEFSKSDIKTIVKSKTKHHGNKHDI